MIHFGDHLKCYGALSYSHWNHVTCCKACVWGGAPGRAWHAHACTHIRTQALHSMLCTCLFTHSLMNALAQRNPAAGVGDCIVSLYQQIQNFDKHFGNEEQKR